MAEGTFIPAVVRFVSDEPAVGPPDKLPLAGLDWIIYGGESDPGYRPHDLAWPREIRDRCAAEGVTFFYKQSPAPRTEMGTTLDGETVRMWPVVRLIGADYGPLRRAPNPSRLVSRVPFSFRPDSLF